MTAFAVCCSDTHHITAGKLHCTLMRDRVKQAINILGILGKVLT